MSRRGALARVAMRSLGAAVGGGGGGGVESRLVQSASFAGVSDSPSATLSAAPSVGNFLVAAISSQTTITAAPSGFTQRLGFVGGQGFYVYTRAVEAGDSATVSASMSGSYATALCVVEVDASAYTGISATASNQGAVYQQVRTLNQVGATGGDTYVHVPVIGATHGTNALTFVGWTRGFAAGVSASDSGALCAVGSPIASAADEDTDACWLNHATNTVGVFLRFAA